MEEGTGVSTSELAGTARRKMKGAGGTVLKMCFGIAYGGVWRGSQPQAMGMRNWEGEENDTYEKI